MSKSPETLSYDTPRPPDVPERLHVWKHLLWPLILINVYGGAIVGPLFSILGVVNFFRTVEGLQMFGMPVTTIPLKVEWLISNAVISVLCMYFVIWHCRRIPR